VAVGFTIADTATPVDVEPVDPVDVEDPEDNESSTRRLSAHTSYVASYVRAIRILLPPGLFTSIEDVKLDLTLSENLPIEQDDKRVTRGAIFLTMQPEAPLLPRGSYEIIFPVELPGEAPNDNVWTLEFCSEATCSSDSVSFPLVGFSENERAVASSGNVEASYAVRRSALSRWCLTFSLVVAVGATISACSAKSI